MAAIGSMMTATFYDMVLEMKVAKPGATPTEPLVRLGDLTLQERRVFFPLFPDARPDDVDIENLEMDTTQEGVTGGNDDLNFTLVKGRKRPNSEDFPSLPSTSSKISRTINQTPTSTHNRFSALPEVQLLSGTQENTVKYADNAKRIRTPKTRFITIKAGAATKETVNKLDKSKQCSFTVSQHGEFLRIFPKTPEDYKIIITKLDEMKVQHYLLPEKTTAPLKVVIRGLPTYVEVLDIEDGLVQLKYQPLKISQMVSFKTKKPMPLFQIHLPDTPESREIFKLDVFINSHVRVENYNRPNRTMQCFKCQYFHHSSANCKMAPRCVKCAGAHETVECTHGAGKIESVKCCNCGESHPASYRGCPKFPENIRKTFLATKVNSSTSFSSLFKPPSPPAKEASPTQTNKPPPTPIDNQNSSFSQIDDLSSILNAIAKELKANSFIELINKFKNILLKIQTAPDYSSKLVIFMEAFSAQSASAP